VGAQFLDTRLEFGHLCGERFVVGGNSRAASRSPRAASNLRWVVTIGSIWRIGGRPCGPPHVSVQVRVGELALQVGMLCQQAHQFSVLHPVITTSFP